MPAFVPRSFVVLGATLWVGCLSLWFASPGSQESLVAEDGFLEWLSALLLLASAILAVMLLGRRGFRPKSHSLVPLVGLLGFLDEVSFGMRFFDWSAPVVHHVRIDGAHDVIDLGYQLGRRHLPAPVFFGMLVAFALAFCAAVWWFRSGILRIVRRHEPLPMALVAGALFVLATTIDVADFIQGPLPTLFEELLETSLALAWVYVALLVGRTRSTDAPGAVRSPADE